ncbi:MAG: DNA polymerase I [Rhodospirillaceae bacterium]|mgnify:CR=1 FL=1|nr:DNA polymerase I [Rhodospirillaceae bacterium]|tara:strand:- start:1286 stop:4081 length:2796 start_codon:yes stop_codon:yes gene_type:complete
MEVKKVSNITHNDQHFYLVDGSGFIFRAFHALPPMSRSDGTPTNAVFGFTNMLIKLIEDLQADHCAVVFDTSRKTFRTELYEDYKANRPPAPDELIPQFPLIREAVIAFNIACIEMDGYEADDLIASYTALARLQNAQVTIVSSDKDLMQLVAPKVEMFDPMKSKKIGVAEVVDKFGVEPESVVDVQALAGDSSDNVPGVPGIGIKTAAQLITEYGDLETLLERANEIQQPKRRDNLLNYAELARISKKLVTLKTDVNVPAPLEALAVSPADPSRILQFLNTQEFKRLVTRFEAETTSPKGDHSSSMRDTNTPDIQYEIVTDREALDSWLSDIESKGIVAFDTETDSLNATRARLVGISFSIEPGKACYIPLRHEDTNQKSLLSEQAPAIIQINFEEAIQAIRLILEAPSILKIGHNIKFDSLVMKQPHNGGINIVSVDDTMSLSYVMNAGLNGHGLDELSELHFGHKNIKYDEVCGTGKSQIPFSQVPIDKALQYAAEDSDMTLRLHRKLKSELPITQMATVYETIERPLIPVLVDMENQGIKVDPMILKQMSEDFRQRLETQADEIYRLSGEEFNIASPKQLGELLFDKLGLSGGKKTKTGSYATGAEILEDLAANGIELASRVLDWRQVAKLKSTYTDALIEEINPATGRIHTSYSMVGASTGRLSSNNPNLQNIPIRTDEGRKIRTAFTSEENTILMSIDYSQIELRLLAEIASIDSLKEAFKNGIDVHAQTASEVFNLPVENMDPMVRRNAKAINFGIIYGISSFGLARQLRCPQGEAKSYIEAYFKKYPGIRTYMENTKKEAREHGYVQTLFGRKIHLSGISQSNPARRGFYERAAINAPIQGTAADIMKRAMIRVSRTLENGGLAAKMLLTVHDELLFEVPLGEIEQTAKVIAQVMETAAEPAIKTSIPLVAEVGTGCNWSEAH